MVEMASFSACQRAVMASAGLGQVGELLLEAGQALLRGVVGLLGQRHALDLELAHAPGDDVDLGGHGVDLDAQPAGGLVDEVDGLVGEEPARDVAVRQDRRAATSAASWMRTPWWTS